MKQVKDSNVEWIGEIPTNWGLIRLQFCLNEVNVKNNPIQTTQILSLMKDVGVLPYEEKGDIGNKSKENVSEYHLAYPNTIVLNCMNILIGSVGISNYFGCVSPVYYVFKETDKCDLRFINYIFNTREFQKELRKYAKGILEIRLRVSADDIFKQKVPLPPKDVQTKIANFLDQKCSEIDSLSADIQSQIDVLKEYKKSIITETVTRGLNPDVEMKDSGVEWIGMIPKHWQTPKMKYITEKITCGMAATPEYVDENNGVLFLSAQNIQNDKLDLTNQKFIPYYLYNKITKNIKPKNGDILQVRVGATIGKTAIVDIDDEFSIYVSLALIRVNKNIINKFLMYYLGTNSFRKNAEMFIDFAGTQGNLNVSDVVDMKAPLPPINEQIMCVDYLDTKCAEIDSIIVDKKAQLKTLAEYKKSLIYEYVTGKKEVPHKNTVITIDPHILLLGMIADKLNTKQEGKVQIQKVAYLSNLFLEIFPNTQYHRYYFGPYDTNLPIYYDTITKNDWYRNPPNKTILVAGKNHNDFKNQYHTLFGDKEKDIDNLINLLKTMNALTTHRLECVATLYAVWNDFLLDRITPSDEQIIEEIMMNWTENKRYTPVKIWQFWLNRMKNYGLIPKGNGHKTNSIPIKEVTTNELSKD